MFKNELTQIGLSEEESVVYEALLSGKSMAVADLIKKTPYKKGNLYNILEDLEKRGLVIKTGKAKSLKFEADHPNKVLEILEQKDQELHKAKKTLEATMPQILSAYNLTHAKPGLRFYEGKRGIKIVGYDSLTAKTDILSFVDLDALKGHKILEADYGRKREKMGIKKKFIVLDTPLAYEDAKTYNWEITNAKVIDAKFRFHSTIMQIYDNKTSYITLEKKAMIGVIIEDEYITNLHRTLFNFMWEKAKPIPH